MKITVVGGGNVGTQIAVHCAEKEHDVVIYSSKPQAFEKHLTVVDKTGNVLHEGDIRYATSVPSEAFDEVDFIFITVPAYCMKDMAEVMYPYMKHGVKICLVPGSGGGECAFSKCIEKGAVVCGLQRVPSVARLVRYGSSVCATGYRERLHAATLPAEYCSVCCQLVEELFDMPCVPLANYLNLTLTPSNPILHTTRLKVLFEDYHSGKKYEKIPLFYEEWNDETSELLFRCDDEVQKICNAMTMFDLSGVKSLRLHYESATPQMLTKKIRSIEGFKGIETPGIRVENGYIPDWNSRYFTADFPYGLAILVQIAKLFGVAVPYMQETLVWYRGVSRHRNEFRYSDYGIETPKEFIEFYKQ